MKLLLSLILIIACASSLINAIRLPVSDTTDCVSVLSSLNGFNTYYKSVSFNGAYENGNQGPAQSSFYEGGYLSIDFANQQMMTQFNVAVENQQPITGQTFIFAKNQTQYVIVNDQCVKVPFNNDLPSLDLTKVGETQIGSINADILAPTTQNSLVDLQILVDSNLCSPLTIESTNTQNETPGFTLLNFYYFVNSVNSNDFVLPAECSDSNVLTAHSTKSIKSYPKFLNNLL